MRRPVGGLCALALPSGNLGHLAALAGLVSGALGAGVTVLVGLLLVVVRLIGVLLVAGSIVEGIPGQAVLGEGRAVVFLVRHRNLHSFALWLREIRNSGSLWATCEFFACFLWTGHGIVNVS